MKKTTYILLAILFSMALLTIMGCSDKAVNQEDANTLNALSGSEGIFDRDGDGRDRDCFEFVLPVTVIMPDGSTITVEIEDDWQLIQDWYEDHPGEREPFTFQFPFDIVFDDGETWTINNDSELQAAYAECEDERGRFEERGENIRGRF